MWYFAWILGIAFACCFAVINGIWYEYKSSRLDADGEQSSTELLMQGTVQK